MESDADSWYGVRAVEARQLAWLTVQFYEALTAFTTDDQPVLPEDLVHSLMCAWFDEELAESGGQTPDDDD